jgi:hypothetical protein
MARLPALLSNQDKIFTHHFFQFDKTSEKLTPNHMTAQEVWLEIFPDSIVVCHDNSKPGYLTEKCDLSKYKEGNLFVYKIDNQLRAARIKRFITPSVIQLSQDFDVDDAYAIDSYKVLPNAQKSSIRLKFNQNTAIAE